MPSSRFAAALVICLLALARVHAGDEPVPVEAFSRLPFVTDVQLSPNGEHLAYLVNDGGGSYLYTQTIAVKQHKQILQTDNVKFRFRRFRWANDDLILVSVVFPDTRRGVDTTETRLLGVRREGSDPKVYFEPSFGTRHYSQLQDGVISYLPDKPAHVLIGLDNERPNFPSVYLLNVETGKRNLVLRYRQPIRDWMTDQQDRVRIGFGYEEGIKSVIVRGPDSKKWKELWKWEAANEPATEVMGFGSDPNRLYVRALHEGRNAIFAMDLSDPALPLELLAHDPSYDIDGDLIYSPKRRDVVGVYDSGADGARIYWDKTYKALQQAVDKGLPDTTNFLIDFSRDERRYVVFAVSDVNPGVFYYGDRDSTSLHPFAEAYPELSDHELSGKESIVYTARDGLTIEGYVTRPWGEPPRPWPAVVMPHGGPHARDYAGFDYMTEFLASRGYVVLQMNFRGSSGYGWEFTQAAIRDMGGKMQDDVTDGVRWLIEKGYADPKRVAVVGGSYGGYAALWGAVKTPDLYRCAVSVNGVSDWSLVLLERQNYVGSETARQQLGKKSDLKQVSPLRRAREIRIPVLLVHGEEDRVVPVEHSRKMARALKKHGKRHRYIELEDGVHSLSNERHRTLWLEAVEAFLAEHMSGASPAPPS